MSGKSIKEISVEIETEEVLIVRRGRRSIVSYCPACGSQVEMVTMEKAAALSRASQRAIFRQVEGGGLHSLENGEGVLFVCLTSLRGLYSICE